MPSRTTQELKELHRSQKEVLSSASDEKEHTNSTQIHPPFRVSVMLSVAPFLVAADSTMINVNLPNIAEYFGVSEATTQWIIQIQLLAVASTAIVAGKLGDKYRSSNMYKLGFVIYSIFTLLCCMTGHNMPMLLVFRALGSAGMSIFIANTGSLSFHLTQPGLVSKTIAFNSLWQSVGITIAPIFGGFLGDIIGWRGCFVFSGLLSSFYAIFFALPRLPKTPMEKTKNKFDFIGAVLLAVFLGALVFAVASVSMEDIPVKVSVVSLIISIISAPIFFKHEGKVAHPIMSPYVLKQKRVYNSILGVLAVCIASFGLIFYGPFIYSIVFGLDSSQTGVFTGISYLGMAFSAFLGTTLGRVITPRIIMTVSAALATFTCFFSGFGLKQSSPWFICLVYFFNSFAQGGAFVVAQANLMATAPPNITGVLGAITYVSNQVGRAIGIAIAVDVQAIYMGANFPDILVTDPGYSDAYTQSVGFVGLIMCFIAFTGMFTLWRVGVTPNDRGKMGFSERTLSRTPFWVEFSHRSTEYRVVDDPEDWGFSGHEMPVFFGLLGM
eukprot:gnl/Dysnectes_brevis/2265_a2654_2149.p1 GENE.gnl/Dysnectes_brevis/2265_a2654_2149~~gnl/Dysnectes_brevis/2265_a2654_2149.p1  ORF type:complete len:553 (-),score=188.17 gnl/Dysnectes_brevis/2265_a2654_2149:72-1730(-)